MSRREPLSSDHIAVEYIGQPREADMFYASIRNVLGRISVGDLGAELISEECWFSKSRLSPVHPPVPYAKWQSTDVIGDTNIPRTVVKQLTDPHITGEWSIHHESVPLSNGTATIDHFGISNDRVYVERHAIDMRTSGYYQGIMEVGTVYSVELAEADMTRLRALYRALPRIH